MKARTKLFGGIGLVGLVIIAVAIFFLFFRDTAPAAVDTAEAEAARSAAVAGASQDDDVEADTGSTSGADTSGQSVGDATDDGETELDSGQPDSAASVGAATDGVWSVDTSIGVFDDTCLNEVCGAGFVGFRINEELVGVGAKTVVGRTPGVSGSMELVGTQVIGAEFVADMTGLITDNEARTDALRSVSGGLETDRFPEARFELTEPVELGELPAEGVAVQVQAVGNLTVHGVTNEIAFPLTAELQAGVIILFGELPGLLLSDYEIPTPTALAVVSVEDNAIMELQLFLSR